MSNTIFVLGILISILIMGYGIELLRFPNSTPRDVANHLKSDLVDIIKGFTEKPKVRHIFEDSLVAELKNVIQPFSAGGMDILIGNHFMNGLPYIEIDFTPSKPMVDEEMIMVSELVKKKIRHYLTVRNLSWKSFASYTQTNIDATIYFYYGEFDADIALLQNKYKEIIREKCGSDFGYLRDEDLDKEIKDATNPPRL